VVSLNALRTFDQADSSIVVIVENDASFSRIEHHVIADCDIVGSKVNLDSRVSRVLTDAILNQYAVDI
jgi:hypothetical protein